MEARALQGRRVGPPQTAMDAWAQRVNRLVAPKRAGRRSSAPAAASTRRGAASAAALWLAADAAGGAAAGYRFSAHAADALVREGLSPALIEALAKASHLPLGELQRFAGLDRTTLKRRAAKGLPLPDEAAVKALSAAELVGLATQVFGSVESAAGWLTAVHPLLEGETPLQRARTPWGLDKVREVLVALRYGGVA